MEKYKVAVVDDNSDAANMIALLLPSEIYAPHVYSEPERFVADYEAAIYCPDVVLLDLAMPGMSGIQVLQRMYELRLPRVPVIAITGSFELDERAKAIAAGAAAAVEKPIDRQTLLELMERSLGRFP